MVEKLLTVKEVCDILNIHENTLRRWADKGTFGEVYRMSTQGDRRFSKENVEHVLHSYVSK